MANQNGDFHAASRVDVVENAINKYIRDNGLKPGDKLPSELELAGLLGVGRNAVREALCRMRSYGLLESKKKRGIVIQTMDVGKNLDKLFNPKMLDKKTLIDLLQLRLWLEKSIIPSIFSKITDRDIEELEDILDSEDENEDGRISVEKESDFHSRINAITGNVIVANLQNSLLPVYRFVHDNLEDFKKVVKETGNDRKVSHREILDALKSRDKVLYSKLIGQHLKAYEKYVNETEL